MYCDIKCIVGLYIVVTAEIFSSDISILVTAY